MFRTGFGTLLNCTAVLRTVRLIRFLNYTTLNKTKKLQRDPFQTLAAFSWNTKVQYNLINKYEI